MGREGATPLSSGRIFKIKIVSPVKKIGRRICERVNILFLHVNMALLKNMALNCRACRANPVFLVTSVITKEFHKTGYYAERKVNTQRKGDMTLHLGNTANKYLNKKIKQTKKEGVTIRSDKYLSHAIFNFEISWNLFSYQ